MKIYINNQPVELPVNTRTLKDFTTWKQIPESGTAIAINGKVITKERWPVTSLNEADQLTVISAAYGG